MTEHLPECPMLEPYSADTTQHCFCTRKNPCIHDEMECICDALRACEERVLNAAREVVEEMDLHGCHPYRFPDCNCLGPQVIAAIDALRKEN